MGGNMSTEELEIEALSSLRRSAHSLAEKLLESLENLSEDETPSLWVEEGGRLKPGMDVTPGDRSTSRRMSFRTRVSACK